MSIIILPISRGAAPKSIPIFIPKPMTFFIRLYSTFILSSLIHALLITWKVARLSQLCTAVPNFISRSKREYTHRITPNISMIANYSRASGRQSRIHPSPAIISNYAQPHLSSERPLLGSLRNLRQQQPTRSHHPIQTDTNRMQDHSTHLLRENTGKEGRDRSTAAAKGTDEA